MRMSRFDKPDWVVKNSVDRCLHYDSIRKENIDDSKTLHVLDEVL